MSGYGPQEAWKLQDKLPFYQTLEEEVTKAEIAGKSIMISLDANSKLGKEWIPKDSHPISQNGRILAGILTRHALVVANGLQGKSSGTITRKRITVDGIKKSTIDLVILSNDLIEEVECVITDEDQIYCLTSNTKTKKGVKVTKSYHSTIVTKFKIKYQTQFIKHKEEIFN